MKKLMCCLGILAMLLTYQIARADVTLKQGFVMAWKDQVVKNMTCVQVVNTAPIPSWGKWNALLDGWTVDVGWAYDGASINNGAVLLGRSFGTLGKYLPFIQFPLIDKIDITLYPIGLYVENFTSHPSVKGCSGGAFIKATVKF